MKHKVNELEGALLDAAVAKAEGRYFDASRVEQSDYPVYPQIGASAARSSSESGST